MCALVFLCFHSCSDVRFIHLINMLTYINIDIQLVWWIQLRFDCDSTAVRHPAALRPKINEKSAQRDANSARALAV